MIDLVLELEPLGVAMALLALGNDLSVVHIEQGKQSGVRETLNPRTRWGLRPLARLWLEMQAELAPMALALLRVPTAGVACVVSSIKRATSTEWAALPAASLARHHPPRRRNA